MSKKILIVLSEYGYWGEELVGPLETFDAAGYEVDEAEVIYWGRCPECVAASPPTAR